MGFDYYGQMAEKANGYNDNEEPLDMTVIRLRAIIEEMAAENTRLRNANKMLEDVIANLQKRLLDRAGVQHVIPPSCEGIGWTGGGW